MTESIGRAVLEDAGVQVTVLSWGAVVQDWQVPLAGLPQRVVLGYQDPESYRSDRFFIGAIVGRVANRIGGAAYTQGGRRVSLKANDGNHQLHGGPDGLSRVNWQLDTDGPRALRLTHLSPPGAGGFPGRVAFTVDMRLQGARLTWDLRAEPDQETPISLAQHNYYALSARLADHRLTLRSHTRLERDAEGIMTGATLPAPGWEQPRALHTETGPLDDFFLFDPGQPVAQVQAANGLTLRMTSDQPGTQVYTGDFLQDTPGGHPDRPLGPQAGFCLEPSGLPNALNCPGFPSILHSPDRPYHQRLSVEIA
jgi:aldose 1-epimerase